MLSDKKFNIILHILFISLIFITNFSIFKDGDLFFHLSVGKEIFNNGFVSYEPFSFHNLQHYTTPQWLADVIFYVIYSKTGFIGLNILMASFYCIFYILIYKVLSKFGLKQERALLITSFSMLSMVSTFLLRPHLFTFIFFIIEVYCLEQFIRKKQWKYLISLPIIAFLAANIHFGYLPLLFIVVLPYLTELIFGFNFERISTINKEKRPPVKYIFIFSFLALVAARITPYFDDNFLFFKIHLISTDITKYVQEWQPLSLGNHTFQVVIIVLFLSVFFVTKANLSMRAILLIGGTLLMTLKSARYYPYLAISMSIYISEVINYISQKFEKKKVEKDKVLKAIFQYTVIGILLAGIIYRVNISPISLSLPEDDYPQSAVEYIKTNFNEENIRMYNSYFDGSYLLFNDLKVFIDSLAYPYISEYNNGANVFFDVVDLVNSKIGVNEIIEKYDLTHALIRKTSTEYYIIERTKYNNIIYEDENFIIYDLTDEIEK
jgi:hypothetical protein